MGLIFTFTRWENYNTKDQIGSYCDFATGKITWSPAAATKNRPASVTEISSRARPYLIKGSVKMNIQNLWRPWNQILPLLMAKKYPSLITFTTNCSITNLKFRSLCKSNQSTSHNYQKTSSDNYKKNGIKHNEETTTKHKFLLRKAKQVQLTTPSKRGTNQ